MVSPAAYDVNWHQPSTNQCSGRGPINISYFSGTVIKLMAKGTDRKKALFGGKERFISFISLYQGSSGIRACHHHDRKVWQQAGMVTGAGSSELRAHILKLEQETEGLLEMAQGCKVSRPTSGDAFPPAP